MQYEKSILIKVPSEQAFSVFDDDRKLNAWMSGRATVILQPKKSKASPIGRKFSHSFAGFVDFAGEVTRYHRPDLVGVHVKSVLVACDVTYTFQPASGGTRMTCTVVPVSDDWLSVNMRRTFAVFVDQFLGRLLGSYKRVAEQDFHSGKGTVKKPSTSGK